MFKIALAASLIASASHAATFYGDEASYQAAGGPQTNVINPDLGPSTSDPQPLDGLSIARIAPSGRLWLGSAGSAFATPSTLIQNAVWISGTENFMLTFDAPVTSMGFMIHEPAGSTSAQDGCNATCVDSLFTVTLLSGGVVQDSTTVSPVDNELTFVGAVSATAFDQVTVVETSGGIDNEFFGAFRYGAASTVPLPAGGWLLLGGFGALARLRRRR